MAKTLDAYLDRQGSRIVQLLQDLVRIPTVNPPGENYLRFVTAAQPLMRELGMQTRVVTVPTDYADRYIDNAADFPRASLIGRLDVGASRTVHFNCHYDVVPTAGKWKYGPFEPKVSGGWLYGRGTSDMKGAIAAVWLAIEALAAMKIQPRMNIEWSLTPDEETGGDLGAGYIVRQGHVQADWAIVCEGGGGQNVGCGHNGVLWLAAEITGKAAHAANPEAGVNAFEQMAAVTVNLQRFKTAIGRRTYSAPDGTKMHPTLNIGGVFGVGPGAKENTVAAAARFTMDRRINPSETLRDAERELRAALREAGAKVPKLRMRVSRLLGIEPCQVDPADPLPGEFAEAVRRVRGGSVNFSVNRGFTDMHFFASDGKIPTIGYGPGGRGAHAIDEAVRVKDLLATAKVYARFLAEQL